MSLAIPSPRSEPRLYWHQEFSATFRPDPRWSPAIQRHAGVRTRWRAAWLISEGPFAGEWACVPAGGTVPGLAWAPESELVDRG